MIWTKRGTLKSFHQTHGSILPAQAELKRANPDKEMGSDHKMEQASPPLDESAAAGKLAAFMSAMETALRQKQRQAQWAAYFVRRG